MDTLRDFQDLEYRATNIAIEQTCGLVNFV